MKIRIKSGLISVFFTLLFFSCSTKLERYDERDSPTSGTLNLFCEEGLIGRIQLQVNTFLAFYENAKVKVYEKTEKQAVEGLFNDSCKAIIINRDLSQQEKKSFSSANIHVESQFIGKNAIAIVANFQFQDTVIILEKLKQLMISDSSNLAKVVFDKSNSGSTLYMIDTLLQGKKPGKNCFAAKNTLDLIEWISKDKNAIGIMDFASLSDQDDPLTKEMLKKVKIIPVSRDPQHAYYYPDQSNIATGDYPFCRNMYIIRRGADFSLGAGVMTFIAGPKGQLMLLKSGLVPAKQEERKIEIKVGSDKE